MNKTTLRSFISLALNIIYVSYLVSIKYYNASYPAILSDPMLLARYFLVGTIFVLIQSIMIGSLLLSILNFLIIGYALETPIRNIMFLYSGFTIIVVAVLVYFLISKLYYMEDSLLYLTRPKIVEKEPYRRLNIYSVYFASLSISTLTVSQIMTRLYSIALPFPVEGVILNALVSSILLLVFSPANSLGEPILMGVFSALGFYSLSQLIGYEAMNHTSRNMAENAVGIKGSSSEGIYLGDIKATLTFGRLRNPYKELHRERIPSKNTWYWKTVSSPLFIDTDDLPNRHIIITGSSGMGKSLLAKHIVVELYTKKKIPFIIIDPHNEYETVRNRINNVRVLDGSLNSVNPLELGRLNPKEKAHQLSSYIAALFGLGHIQRYLLEELIIYTYESNHSPPTMNDVLNTCKELMKTNDLFKKVFPYIRILADEVFASTTLEFAKLVETPSIITLNNMKSDYVRALYVNTLLQKILDEMYMGNLNKRLTIVIDEAHMFLKKETKNTVMRLLMESRKYGIGLIIITQQPLNIPEPVIENSSIKISFNVSEPRNLDYAAKMLSFTNNNVAISRIKDALKNIGMYHYVVSLTGYNKIFIVSEQHIAENVFGR